MAAMAVWGLHVTAVLTTESSPSFLKRGLRLGSWLLRVLPESQGLYGDRGLTEPGKHDLQDQKPHVGHMGGLD